MSSIEELKENPYLSAIREIRRLIDLGELEPAKEIIKILCGEKVEKKTIISVADINDFQMQFSTICLKSGLQATAFFIDPTKGGTLRPTGNARIAKMCVDGMNLLAERAGHKVGSGKKIIY